MFYSNDFFSDIMYMSDKPPSYNKLTKRIDPPKYDIIKMLDRAESTRVNKVSTWDLPMRVLAIGRSQLSGKSNVVGNWFLRPFEFGDPTGQGYYFHDFIGENIYIVCPSTDVDQKWESIIEGKQIPAGNIYNTYDEMELTNLYNKLADKWMDAQNSEGKIKHEHVAVVFDDMSFGGNLKSKINGVMSRFACNSRHYLISVVVTAQKYTDVSTAMRENATGFVFFNCSYKQRELIYSDVGEMPKKVFMKMFEKTTHEKHSFMVVNYTNASNMRFLDQHFQPIELNETKQIPEDKPIP